MEKKEKGIVLSTQEYNEFDQIIIVLMEKSGVKTLMAKGTLKIQSKNAPNIQVGNYSDFVYFSGRLNNVSKLKKALVINNFLANKKDVNKFSMMTYILEVTKNILEKNWELNQKKWCAYLLKILQLLQQDSFLALIKFCQFSLNEMGMKTISDGCGKCGSRKYIAYINHSYHGLVCYLCSQKSYSKTLVLDFIKITKWEGDTKITIDENNKISIANFYIEWINSFVLVSKQILKAVKLLKN